MFNKLYCVTAAVALFFLVSHSFGQNETAADVADPTEQGVFPARNEVFVEAIESTDEANSEIANRVARDSGPALAPHSVNFGYLQNYTVLPYIHYESYTHLASAFVGFDYDGTISSSRITTFRNRPAALKAGGAADQAGTKLIACVNNPCDIQSASGCSSFDPDKLAAVMQSSANRTRLVQSVVKLVTEDGYCQGVNFDFEPYWNSVTRDGITLFLQQMRAALPLPYEISVYVHPTYNPTYWGNVAQFIDYVDYVQYSTYDYGTSRAHANSDYNSSLAQANIYMEQGVPPEKLILTWASYGRRWSGISAYDQDGETGLSSRGFYDGLYNVTLNTADGGPHTLNYVAGDEIGWHTYKIGGTDYTVVHETPESLEFKIAAAVNFPIAGQFQGRRLAGVGWWSLMWFSNYSSFQSYDPRTAGNVNRPPYYRHGDLLVQEILKNKGQTAFNLESFESENLHWLNPSISKDTSLGVTSALSYLAAPNGSGRPEGSVKAARISYNFSASNQQALFHYELLNNINQTMITDTNATLAPVSKNTRFRGSYYVSGNYSNRQLRLALVDGARQMEVSDPITLPSTSGWYNFTWDINDPAQVNAWNTNEPALLDGNGVVNTSSPDARDISFLGFIVSGGPSGTATIYFDELTYESHAPGGKNYVINEYRYANSNSEFVEISGPPGPFPSDMQLISYNPDFIPGGSGSAGNSTLKVTALGGYTIPASGMFVVGDPGVPGTTGLNGIAPSSWSTASDDIPNNAPGGLQLYGNVSGHVYDSVVYRAFGGVSNLARAQARRVTGEGYPWTGEVATGVSANFQPHSMGRMPDGNDTQINANDFSLMAPTPGSVNGASDIINVNIDFSSIPYSVFQAYGTPTVSAPAAGIPASPNGGNVYKCVDLPGGTIAYFGDALTGDDRGIDITGELYIPAASQPVQAIGVGFCGTQGSTFFGGNAAFNGYENGYWLIYENGAVGLNNGLTDHDKQFEFIMASNDNQDAEVARPLGGRKTLTSVGAAANTWVTFHFRLDPHAPVNEQLVAQVNGTDVYRGPVPEDGRRQGAFMVGHREGTGSASSATKATWIDNLKINYANPPTRVENYELY